MVIDKAANFYRRNIKINYVYSFFQSMNITQGFWMIYLSAKGLDLIQLGILEGLFHVTSFLMETPTGAIADIFGRKTSRILGRFFIIAYILMMLNGNTFPEFILAFIFCAIGWNLESGAGDALVYDSLLETHDEGRYMKVNGWIEVSYQTAQATALLLGGWIALQSYDKLFTGQILIIIVSLAVATFFRETQIGRAINAEKQAESTRKGSFISNMVAQYRDSYYVIKGSSRLLYFLIFMNALGVFSTTAFFYMQIYCHNNGINESTMGILFAASCIFGALGGILAHRIEQKIQERQLMIALPIIYMLLMWGMVSFKTAVWSFLFIGLFDSILYVVYFDYINRLIPSDKRATLLSFSSMVFSFFMLIIFPIFGTFGEYWNLETAFFVLAMIATSLCGANLIVLKYAYNKKRV
jgi:MFS family permease